MSVCLTIDVLTLFPEMIAGFLSESILGRARDRGLINVGLRHLRDWAKDKHQITDDRPFGGGAGMLLKPEPVFQALDEVRQENSHVIYMAPDGEPLTADLAKTLSREKHLIIISGHYEGVDQRVRDCCVDREVSIGDFVLTNGTLPAAVLIDAVSRYIPGVLGEEKSLTQDSFNDNLLSFPQYTRPAIYRGMSVPDVLLSGNHKEIERWREECRLEKTKKRRPDLLHKYQRTSAK